MSMLKSQFLVIFCPFFFCGFSVLDSMIPKNFQNKEMRIRRCILQWKIQGAFEYIKKRHEQQLKSYKLSSEYVDVHFFSFLAGAKLRSKSAWKGLQNWGKWSLYYEIRIILRSTSQRASKKTPKLTYLTPVWQNCSLILLTLINFWPVLECIKDYKQLQFLNSVLI